jgi:hypothetical protein
LGLGLGYREFGYKRGRVHFTPLLFLISQCDIGAGFVRATEKILFISYCRQAFEA